MLKLERARLEDAEAITEIKIAAFNREINTYLGRNGGPPGYDSVESEIDIIHNFIAYKIMLDDEIIGGLFLTRREMKQCILKILLSGLPCRGEAMAIRRCVW